MKPLELAPSKTVLVVIDAQEKLFSAMRESDRARCERGVGILLDAAARLGVPTIVTEQYPRGLGPTLPALAEKARSNSSHAFVEKLEFDAGANEGFASVLARLAPSPAERKVILCGMEAHICVYQTARAIARMGFEVHVAADATASRDLDGTATSARVARSLWEKVGALETCAETVVFDWLGKAEGDDFKFVSKLVR